MTYLNCSYIDKYIDGVRSGSIPASDRIKKAVEIVQNRLSEPDVWIDTDTIEKAVELIPKYFGYQLFDWELFILALVFCYYKSSDTVVFRKFFIMMGRGNGKNGFISPLVWFLTTQYHGLKKYNVDIIANSEDQAKESFNDVHEVLEEHKGVTRNLFTWTKEEIKSKPTQSYIKYNTSNAKTKDGKRSSCLVFDEVHGYEDYKGVNVFTAGFGKKKHSRIFMITTSGYVRAGVLDKELEIADKILNGEITKMRTLPLVWSLDKEEEYKNPDHWHKANPSLRFKPELKIEMDEAFEEMKYNSETAIDFMTKRMNIPKEDVFERVAPYEKIKATNKLIPDMTDHQCIGALDYGMVNDFASAGLWFKDGEKRYWMEHTWVCHKALQNPSREIKFPIREAEEKGLITVVESDSIDPGLMAQWFLERMVQYDIVKIVADEYRLPYVQKTFEEYGLEVERIRSGFITHSKTAPIIQRYFYDELLHFGDNMTMRWYTNNTAIKVDNKGNITFHKISPRAKKTDGFFALMHAVSVEDSIMDGETFSELPEVMVF